MRWDKRGRTAKHPSVRPPWFRTVRSVLSLLQRRPRVCKSLSLSLFQRVIKARTLRTLQNGEIFQSLTAVESVEAAAAAVAASTAASCSSCRCFSCSVNLPYVREPRSLQPSCGTASRSSFFSSIGSRGGSSAVTAAPLHSALHPAARSASPSALRRLSAELLRRMEMIVCRAKGESTSCSGQHNTQ